MPFQKGHKLSVGNNGGKNWHERLNKIIKTKTKQIHKDAIIKLADNVVARKLVEFVEEDTNKISEVKDIALPVYLKSKADKTEHKETINIKFDESFETSQQTEDNNPVKS